MWGKLPWYDAANDMSKHRTLDTDAVPEYCAMLPALFFSFFLFLFSFFPLNHGSRDFCLFITHYFPREHEQSKPFFLFLWPFHDRPKYVTNGPQVSTWAKREHVYVFRLTSAYVCNCFYD